MSEPAMQTFLFDGNSLEEIHQWMHEGQGVDGIQPAVEALSGLAKDLDNSMDSLREALTKIGAWVGPAGEGANEATRQGGEWVVTTTPQVTDSAQSTDAVASAFVSTKARMPSPAEAELTDSEKSIFSAVPILGPMLDRQKADEKQDQVTNEARQRMQDWQDSAQEWVNAVQPLPPVPQPVVDVAAPQQSPGSGVGGVSMTEVATAQVASLPPGMVAAGPVPSGSGGPAPSGLSGPPPAVASPLPPGTGRPALPVPQPPAVTPPGGQVPPAGRVPGGGMPIFPLPVVGGAAGDTAGRRRAYGPGVFEAEEIARSRGGSGGTIARGGLGGGAGAVANRAGVLGAAPDEHANRGAAGSGPAAEADEHASRRGATAGSGRAGSGSIMQPAVGSARGEEDSEHSDKYAMRSDEYFAGDPHRVAPPVIGG